MKVVSIVAMYVVERLMKFGRQYTARKGDIPPGWALERVGFNFFVASHFSRPSTGFQG